MLRFDPRSFIITSALLGALCAFIFFVLRRSFPRDIRGIAHWGWSCLLMLVAGLLFAMRDASSPVLFSSYLANLLVVSGVMLMHVSLKRFDGQEGDYQTFAMMLVCIAAGLVWFTFVRDDYRARVLLIAAVNMTLFFMCALVIFRMRRRNFAERLTAGVFLLTSSVSFLRFGAAFFQPDYATPVDDVSSVQHVYLATFAFSVVALSLGFLLMVNRKLQTRLEYSASHDFLTNTYTRGAFFELLAQEMQRAARHRQPLSLLMIDLDNFKTINDEHGHPVGDQVILDFVRRTQQVLRSHDSLGRYGGEEFGVILPNTSREDAYIVADRIRAAFGQARGDALPVYTVSVGLTSSAEVREDIGAFLGKADQALYLAKKSGKNRVAVLV